MEGREGEGGTGKESADLNGYFPVIRTRSIKKLKPILEESNFWENNRHWAGGGQGGGQGEPEGRRPQRGLSPEIRALKSQIMRKNFIEFERGRKGQGRAEGGAGQGEGKGAVQQGHQS